MFKNDYDTLRTEVYKHPQSETGGNLFGQWTTSGSAVIHVVLGPGQHCRRTDTSFEQDMAYMKRVGRFVKDCYSLCHIGEWRSHHSLSLNKPSAEEEHHVRRTFPQGMSKFLVVIANIENRDSIMLSPYFFTDGGTRYEKAEYVGLKSNNPFSTRAEILAEINLKAEGNEYQRNETSRCGASLTGFEISRSAGSNSQRNDNTRPTYSQTTSTSGRPTLPADRAAAQNTNDPPRNVTVQNQAATSDDDVTLREIILKETHDELRRYFGSEGKVDIEGTIHGDVQMTFKHDIKYWMVRFPKTFPSQPAQLFWSHSPASLSRISPIFDFLLEKPLKNHVNILLSIKKNCYGYSCKICKNFTKENLAKPAPAKTAVSSRLEDVVKSLTNEIEMTDMAAPLSFAGGAQNDGSYKVSFDHNFIRWLITFPPEFPDKPAEIHKQIGYGAEPQKIHYFSNTKHEQEPLVSSVLIISAIYINCGCFKCKRKKS